MFTARPRRTRTCGKRDKRRERGRLASKLNLRFLKKERSSYDAPDDKRDFELMGEAEDGEA